MPRHEHCQDEAGYTGPLSYVSSSEVLSCACWQMDQGASPLYFRTSIPKILKKFLFRHEEIIRMPTARCSAKGSDRSFGRNEHRPRFCQKTTAGGREQQDLTCTIIRTPFLECRNSAFFISARKSSACRGPESAATETCAFCAGKLLCTDTSPVQHVSKQRPADIIAWTLRQLV